MIHCRKLSKFWQPMIAAVPHYIIAFLPFRHHSWKSRKQLNVNVPLSTGGQGKELTPRKEIKRGRVRMRERFTDTRCASENKTKSRAMANSIFFVLRLILTGVWFSFSFKLIGEAKKKKTKRRFLSIISSCTAIPKCNNYSTGPFFLYFSLFYFILFYWKLRSYYVNSCRKQTGGRARHPESTNFKGLGVPTKYLVQQKERKRTQRLIGECRSIDEKIISRASINMTS